MLEQRRAEEKGYITLKEAAKIANYTPDYVGQLIRAGKIKGEQVYNNVAWVTTEDEINSYLTNKGRAVAESDNKVFFSDVVLKYFLYAVIAFSAVVILSLQYILYVSIDTHLNESYLSHTATETSGS